MAVDGGSTDGAVEWLSEQPDVTLIRQALPLTGATVAYNLGFIEALKLGAEYIVIINDDDEFVADDPPQIEVACAMLRDRPEAGAVAFPFDLRGEYTFETWGAYLGLPKGVIRRETLLAVSAAQGDLTGGNFWDKRWHTYCADMVASFWVQRLGWEILRGDGLRIHDRRADVNALGPLDEMQRHNQELYHGGEGGPIGEDFMAIWGDPKSHEYNAEEAARYGGRVQ